MSKESEDTGMRDEYDFSQSVRGKYAQSYQQGSKVVVLAPDVAARFTNAESVNQALRSLVNVRDGKSKSQ